MRTFIPFAIVILMSTVVAETAAAQTLPAPQAVTDPKQIASKPNAQVEPRSLTIEKLYMTRQVGRPTWSPDGKSIAFIRNRKELRVISLDGSNDRVLARGEFDNNTIAWSPDSHWVVYVPTGPDGFSNLFAVPAAGGAEPRPLTFLANGEGATRIAWMETVRA